MLKRFLAWLLAVVMLLTCFYGCGKAKPQGDEDLSEVFRLTLSYHADRDKEGVSRRIPTEEALLALGAETVRSRTEKNFSVEIHGEANTQAFYLAVLEKLAIPRKDPNGILNITVESVRKGEAFENHETPEIEISNVGGTLDGCLEVAMKDGKRLWEKLYTPEDFPEECGIEGVVMKYYSARAEAPKITVYFSPQGEQVLMQTKEWLQSMDASAIVDFAFCEARDMPE